MNSIAADLFTGRTSEINALRELIREFEKVPQRKAFIAPPRSSLRMRTLRGGARYYRYVEKLNRRAKDRINILQTAAISV